MRILTPSLLSAHICFAYLSVIDLPALFYRRALAANDLDPLVLANYRSFCLERIPGGAYPGGGPGSRVLRRSRLDGQWWDTTRAV